MMTRDAAIVIVAQRIIEALVTAQIGDAHESWPEIGEHDWADVQRIATHLAADGSGTLYDQAYALLAARAETC